jgi:putative tryptophan/tyrosine transport system substrate-binding protein
MESFRKGLRELGLAEGQNLKIDWRFAEGQGAMLARLATELVGLNPDVLVTPSGDGIRALRNVTTAIPIVMAGARARRRPICPSSRRASSSWS